MNEKYNTTDQNDPLWLKIRFFWEKRRLCDFEIKVEDKSFQTHKLILACSSDYFQCMFNHDTVENASNVVTLKEEVTPLAMEKILNFWYGSKLALEDNPIDVLVAAHFLQSKFAQDKSVEYLKENIDLDNCLDIYLAAIQCNLEELFEVAFNYCLHNFTKLIEREDFLELNDENLIDLISSDKLNVDCELTVFKSVYRWISHDHSRIPKTAELMSHVRFTLLNAETMKFLCEATEYEIFNQSVECCKLINQALFQQALEPNKDTYPHRKPLITSQRIYAIGGWPNGFRPTNSTERYDRYQHNWSKLQPMKKARCGVGISLLNDSIYAIGGHDGTDYLRDVERFDLKTDTWQHDVAPMSRGRNSLGAVTLNGHIYAIGGQGGTSSLNTVECYDPKINVWRFTVPMLERRLGLGVAVLNGKIYALGGADTTEVSKTVELFDPEKKTWSYTAPMLTERKHFGCTALGGKIYAVGGRGTENSHELNTAECYDPKTETWTMIASMKRFRSGIGLVALDGLLYAVGGHNGDMKLHDVEVYDPVKDVWAETHCPMLEARLGAGVVVNSIYENWR